MKTLALIHTISSFRELIYEPFAVPFEKEHPDIRIHNIMDDSLLAQTTQFGACTAPIIRRIYRYVQCAAELGASCAMITCTSVNLAARVIRPMAPIDVFNIDEPNVREAVKAGRRIGVLATLHTSPPATISLLEAEAADAGKRIEVLPVVVDGAFDILVAGNRPRHDEMVCEALYKLAKEVDAICFAQVSMGMLKHDPCPVPLFKIGKSGFDHAAKLLEGK